mmetsp:Transcript_21042/g.45639  ORF Transcript_21042/g.45639 Transcript_21042/m.45639 type:complete len:110 (-) Transcript_21042:168-497(-)
MKPETASIISRPSTHQAGSWELALPRPRRFGGARRRRRRISRLLTEDEEEEEEVSDSDDESLSSDEELSDVVCDVELVAVLVSDVAADDDRGVACLLTFRGGGASGLRG